MVMLQWRQRDARPADLMTGAITYHGLDLTPYSSRCASMNATLTSRGGRARPGWPIDAGTGLRSRSWL